MGKAAKAHRKKVAKRNVNVKLQEKRMQKLWQEAFEEQMKVMKEKFAAMSGDTMSGDTMSELMGLLNEENLQEETTQEQSGPTESVQGE
jgi:DNA primase large subunit